MTARIILNNNIVRLLLIFAAVAAALIIILSGRNVIQAEEESNPHKYYTSISIEPGDTLWSIACTFSDGHYSSIQEYIDEVKILNNLTSDTIHANEYLLVPYFRS